MPASTDLLVIGAGPYAYSAAAFARDNGIDTHVVGHPMAFWREQMPADMFLRSGPGWHLDGSGTYTFEAFFEDRGMSPEEFDPVPIAVFLDYTEWFRDRTSLDVDERMVADVTTAERGLPGDDGGRLDDHGGEGARRPRHPPLRQPPGVVRDPYRRSGGRTRVSWCRSTSWRAPAS